MTTPKLPWARTPMFAHVEVGKVLVQLDYLSPKVIVTGSLPWPGEVVDPEATANGVRWTQEIMRLIFPWPKGIQAMDKETATGDSDETLVAIEALLRELFAWQETSGREGLNALSKD